MYIDSSSCPGVDEQETPGKKTRKMLDGVDGIFPVLKCASINQSAKVLLDGHYIEVARLLVITKFRMSCHGAGTPGRVYTYIPTRSDIVQSIVLSECTRAPYVGSISRRKQAVRVGITALYSY